MTNSVQTQLLGNGAKHVTFKITGVLDNGDINIPSILTVAMVKDNTTPYANLVGFRVNHLEWSISTPMEILLAWNGQNPQQITPLAGRGKIAGDSYGGTYPDQTRTGYDGSINISSSGAPNGTGTQANFTIVLELIKLYKV